ncbi:MAG TPA: hypothetical protein VNC50_05815, partial [Planctomycetia bacterium]|nr:hypothetical protein [Planctomycetia bacterium]
GMFRSRSLALAVICGAAATLLGLYTEWKFAPFVGEESFGHFLKNVTRRAPITLILIAVGGVLGFYGPYSQWRRWRTPRE